MDGSISITKSTLWEHTISIVNTFANEEFLQNSTISFTVVYGLLKGTAQQDAFFSLYRHHLNIINPVAAGTQEGSYLNMSLRSQWLGIDGAPETQAISYGMPTDGNRVGIGFSLINDQTFIEKQTQFYANFSYRSL